MIRKRRKYRSIVVNKNRIGNIKIIVCAIILILGIIFIQIGLELKQNILPIYSYEAKKDANYNVELKPNDFYEEKILPPDRYYASKSINNFLIDFQYNFKANKKANLNYSYMITAELVGNVNTTDNKDKQVWNRIFKLFDDIDKTSNDTDQFIINKQIAIDYETYSNLVTSYERTYGITIDTILKVNLKVYIDIKINDLETQKLEDNVELDIPVTTNITQIDKNYTNTEGKIDPKSDELKVKELIMYIAGGTFIAISIIVFIITIVKKQKGKTPEDIYLNHIKKILKYYGEFIVTVKNEPNLKELEIIDVLSMGDLVDIAQQSTTNIIRYELGRKNYFYVIINKYAYRYIIKEESS